MLSNEILNESMIRLCPYSGYYAKQDRELIIQSHLGKNAYTTYVLDTGSFLYQHMLIPNFTWYKHMLISLMNLYKVVSFISVFS